VSNGTDDSPRTQKRVRLKAQNVGGLTYGHAGLDIGAPPAIGLASGQDCLGMRAFTWHIFVGPIGSSLSTLAASGGKRRLGRICGVGVLRQSKGLEHPGGPVCDLSCFSHSDGMGSVLDCPEALT